MRKMQTLGPNCVAVTEENGDIVLYSYDTEILTIDANKRLISVTDKWDFSLTTGKHIGMFKNYLGLTNIPDTKKERAKYFAPFLK